MNLYRHPHICIPSKPTKAVGQLAVELAGLIGFHSLALDFPLVSTRPSAIDDDFNVIIQQGTRKAERKPECLSLWIERESDVEEMIEDIASDFGAFFPIVSRSSAAPVPESFVFASQSILSKPAPASDPIGVENFLLPGPWLRDEDGDFLPDLLDISLEISPAADADTYAAAADIAAALGAQTTTYRYPIIGADRQGCVRFSPAPHLPQVNCVGSTIIFEGKKLSAFTVSLLKLLLPDQDGLTPSRLIDTDGRARTTLPLQKWLKHLHGDLTLRNTDGQFAWALSHQADLDRSVICQFNPDAQAWNTRNHLLEPAQVQSHKDDQTVWQLKRAFPWEVDRFRKLFSQKVLKRVKPGDHLELHAALSESQAVRQQLAEELRQQVASRGATADIRIISAYKQGYSWLDEYVAPKLQALADLDHLIILYKPYLPPGKTEFLEEDGATPKITSERVDDPDHWFDLPIRPLQELYPIDDTLARSLKMVRDRISFETYQGSDDLTYQIHGLASDGSCLFSESLKAVWSERPYLDRYADIGKVHPATGYLNASLNGSNLLSERVPTDLELVWDVYQAEVLPAVTDYLLKQNKGRLLAANQPFFSKLELRLDVSEPDFDLPSRTDRVSSLDAMHEDLYFVGLDYFRTLGLRLANEKITSPGLVLPILRNRVGKPKLTVKLTIPKSKTPLILRSGKIIQKPLDPGQVSLSISQIQKTEQGLKLSLSIKAPEKLKPVLKQYGKLIESSRLTNSLAETGISEIAGTLNSKAFRGWRLPDPQPKRRKVRALLPEDFHIPQTEVVGYAQYLRLIQQVQRVPGLRVVPVAESYQGRVIHAIEIRPQTRGWLPRVKWITAQPSIYINARHHANEVSSTITSFNLAKTLAGDQSLREQTKNLNIVLVPFENADGAAIHYELMRDNPRWKLHVARYNALGTEIAQEYFKDDTIQTEALAFTRVWRKWLPDVIVDDHGVPTHEWDQPFSGYTSPWFKGFWLPRALLYSYFFHIKDERFEGNLLLNKAVEHVVAQSLKTDERIIALNKDWRNRFYTFANKWLPSLFPANYYEDMISYWIPSPYSMAHNYAAVRYPWVTSVSFVSEVSDETAQGDYLALCALAHYNHDIAILKMLSETAVITDRTNQTETHGGQLVWKRKRPVICKHAGKEQG